MNVFRTSILDGPCDTTDIPFRTARSSSSDGVRRDGFGHAVSPLPFKKSADSSRVNHTKRFTISDHHMGSGTYGMVKKGDMGDRICAVKVIPKRSEFSTDSLRKELGIFKDLDHPSIVKFFDMHENHENLYVSMEPLLGGELFERLAKKGAMCVAETCKVMRQALASVAYLHRSGIVHRDIKPENFMFTNSKCSNLKLIDFGHAARFKPGQKLKGACGSLSYVAPEVARGVYDEKCDIWALGIMMYVCLTAMTLTADENRSDVIKYMRNSFVIDGDGKPDKTEITTTCWDFLCLMLTPNPKERPSAFDLLGHPLLCSYTPTALYMTKALINAQRSRSESTADDSNHNQPVEGSSSVWGLGSWSTHIETMENSINGLYPEDKMSTDNKAKVMMSDIERMGRNVLAVETLLKERILPGWRAFSNLNPLQRAMRYFVAKRLMEIESTASNVHESCTWAWVTFFNSIDPHGRGLITSSSLRVMVETVQDVAKYIRSWDSWEDLDDSYHASSDWTDSNDPLDEWDRNCQDTQAILRGVMDTERSVCRVACDRKLSDILYKDTMYRGFFAPLRIILGEEGPPEDLVPEISDEEDLTDQICEAFRCIDLTGTGMVEMTEFYASVFANSILMNRSLLDDIYDYFLAGDSVLTSAALRDRLGWTQGLTFYPRVWRVKNQIEEKEGEGTDEERVNRMLADLAGEDGIITRKCFYECMEGANLYTGRYVDICHLQKSSIRYLQ